MCVELEFTPTETVREFDWLLFPGVAVEGTIEVRTLIGATIPSGLES